MKPDQLLHFLETLDRTTLDFDEYIPGLETGFLGCGALDDGIDTGRRIGLADNREGDCEDDDGKDEIGGRSGKNDRRLLPQLLVDEGNRPVRFGDGLAIAVRAEVVLPEHFHIPAERYQAELPAGARAVRKTEDFPAKAD